MISHENCTSQVLGRLSSLLAGSLTEWVMKIRNIRLPKTICKKITCWIVLLKATENQFAKTHTIHQAGSQPLQLKWKSAQSWNRSARKRIEWFYIALSICSADSKYYILVGNVTTNGTVQLDIAQEIKTTIFLRWQLGEHWMLRGEAAEEGSSSETNVEWIFFWEIKEWIKIDSNIVWCTEACF